MKTGAAELLARFCRERRLPAAFERAVAEQLWPLAQWIAGEWRACGHCLVVGINGAQGTGKSTVAAVLQLLLVQSGLRAAVLSIDDLYLTRAQRSVLARSVHPLLATRGVPGTHDVDLGVRLLERLRDLGASETCRLPRFDKLADDRSPADGWPAAKGPIDVVLFEGWCVGTPPQSTAALAFPANALEAGEDADGRWRRWVNDRLREDYPRLFAAIDRLIFLRTPDFGRVLAWRQQQETGLARRTGSQPGMTGPALHRFVQHYERLTRHALATLPARADVCIELAEDHRIARVHYRETVPGRPVQAGQTGAAPAAS